MKIKSAEFESSAPALKACPKWPLPEFAFIGRSNVGKSSLINMLTERRDLAKVSDLPGKTKLMNFFVINRSWSLVDLPGYGYAHTSKVERVDFNEANADFLENRRNLRGVFVLLDSRLPPQAIDLDFVQWLASCRVPFVLVFTKGDKQSNDRGKANIRLFQQSMAPWTTVPPQTFLTSSKTKAGREDILGYITAKLAEANRPAE